MAADDLTTLAKVKAFLEITDAAADAILGTLITAMSKGFVREIRRDVLQKSYIETFNGDDDRVAVRTVVGAWLPGPDISTAGYALNLRNYPVTNVTAVVIDGERIPPVAAILSSATPSASGGTLATGIYYYVVTALDEAGETMASNELAAVVTGPNGSVALAWLAVPGATGYKVWRGTVPAGESVYFSVAANLTVYTDTGGAGAAGELPTSRDGFAIDLPTGRLQLVGFSFTTGIQNAVVAYTAGLAATIDSVPADIDQAVIEMVAWRFKERDRIGQQSKGMGADTVTFAAAAIPPSAQLVIDFYSREPPV